MILGNVWLDVAAVGILTFLLYLLLVGRVLLKRRMRLSVVFFRAFFVSTIIVSLLFSIETAEPSTILQPFASWWRISEIGYKAIWLKMARQMLPFAFCGFLLPLAHRSANRYIHAIVFSFSMAILYGALRFAGGSLDLEELTHAFLGSIVGYSFTALLAGLFPKIRSFKIIEFKTSGYVTGVLILMFTFFACVGALLIDSGSDFIELKLPVQSRQIPNVTVSSQLELSQEKTKIDTYQIIKTDVAADTQRIADIMGVAGTAVVSGENASLGEVKNGDKILKMQSSGSWSYVDESVLGLEGNLPGDEECIDIAGQIARNGAARNYEIYQSTVEATKDAQGNITGKKVFIEAALGGRLVVGSGEFTINIGANGMVYSVDKHDPDFEPYKKASIISAQEAYDLVVSNGRRSDGKLITVSHTLYNDEASAAEITGAEIAFWQEEVKGYMQPIWLFSARATLVDGSEKDFQFRVPAIRY